MWWSSVSLYRIKRLTEGLPLQLFLYDFVVVYSVRGVFAFRVAVKSSVHLVREEGLCIEKVVAFAVNSDDLMREVTG